jgi:hypothetical protein
MRVEKATLLNIAECASALWLLCEKNSSVLEDIVIALWKGSAELSTKLGKNYQMEIDLDMATRLFDMLLLTMRSNASEQLSNREYEHFEELLLSYKRDILAEEANS